MSKRIIFEEEWNKLFEMMSDSKENYETFSVTQKISKGC